MVVTGVARPEALGERVGRRTIGAPLRRRVGDASQAGKQAVRAAEEGLALAGRPLRRPSRIACSSSSSAPSSGAAPARARATRSASAASGSRV